MTPAQKRGSGALVLAGTALLTLIGNFEGSEQTAYADKLAYGIPTVCNGHTGPEVKVGDVWSKERCDAILVKDVEAHGKGLLSCTTVAINQNEYNAYNSWSFNVGIDAACHSTLIQMLNAGDHVGACNQLLRWNRAGGRVVRGLTVRRTAERDLCLRPMPAPEIKASA